MAATGRSRCPRRRWRAAGRCLSCAPASTDLSEEIRVIEAGARAKSEIWDIPGVPLPLARWSFTTDGRDEIGCLNGTLHGGAVVENGRLKLNGRGAFVETEPLRRPLSAKTIEAWVSLPNHDQRGGAILSIQTPGGAMFDGLVYGERQPRKWTAGSSLFERTKDLDAPTEDAPAGAPIHVAVTFDRDNRIALYRNGVPYGAPYVPDGPNGSLRTFPAGQARILLGLRHSGAANGFLEGEILEARLYDRALTPEQVRASFLAGMRKRAPAAANPQGQSQLSPPGDHPSSTAGGGLPSSSRGPTTGNHPSGTAGSGLPSSLKAFGARRTPEQLFRLGQLIAERDQIESRLGGPPPLSSVYAARPQQPGPTYLLLRGDVQAHGDLVCAGGIASLSASDFGLQPDAPEGERRLRFADWVVGPAGALAARVMVNRVWHYHFGRGLVASPNDFGFNGERPTNPELLDWLAATFTTRSARDTETQSNADRMRGWEGERVNSAGSVAVADYSVSRQTEARTRQQHGAGIASPPHPLTPSPSHACSWRLKPLHRLILLSNTYQQSSAYNPVAAAQDADDRWLWRFAPRRLEGRRFGTRCWT